MKMTVVLTFVVGLVIGALMTMLVLMKAAPGMMIVEDDSPLGFEETVESLVAAAEAKSWKVPIVHDLRESMAKAGHDVLPASVVELCRPDLAARILSEDSARNVTSMMPCRIAVYQKADGSVIVSRMNTSLVARVFGGLVTEVMGDATADSEEIVGALLTR